MEIGDWVLTKIEQKGVTKSLIYKSLNMTEAGFRGMIKKNNLSIKNYLKIVELLSIDPKEYFNMNDNKIIDSSIYEPKEYINEYLKIKNEEIELKKENAELKKQNAELIKIISNLTTK